MIQRDYLIIGSGIGGSSACESIRKYDKRGQITLVGAETYPPYKRWMLSKSFLRDKVPPLKKLPVLDARWPCARWRRWKKRSWWWGADYWRAKRRRACAR